MEGEAPLVRSGHALALALMALLALHVVLAWLALQATFTFVELVWRATAGRSAFGALLPEHVAQFRALRLVQAGGWFVTAGLFLVWLRRAGASLQVRGASARHDGFRPAVLGRPWRALVEIWATSAGPGAPSGVAPRGPGRLRAWGGLVLLAAAAHAVTDAGTLAGREPISLGAVQALALGSCVEIAAAVLGITVVWTIDQRQEERRAPAGGA